MFTLRGLTPAAVWQLATARSASVPKACHTFICVADHFEPKWNQVPRHVQIDRVRRWVLEYPRLAEQFADSRGQKPQHSFFYPQDEYESHLVEPIAELCRRGFGDVEVHLHHDHDTSDGLREKLSQFTDALHNEHGLLKRDNSGRITYGFIHGNWALDNSRPDGRWCGVNDEISVLLETGCYADFTLPSAPSPAQTSTINSLYYALDDPCQPKSHDQGTAAMVAKDPPENTLLMIQGPLAADWQARKWGVVPRLETGDLRPVRPPTLDRLRLWLKAAVTVQGREDWCFIKLHAHGTQEPSTAMLLGEPMRRFHQELAEFAARNPWFYYYYVTAREMAELVHQAEQGQRQPTFGKRRCQNPLPQIQLSLGSDDVADKTVAAAESA
jgi:hypothetical protein